MIPAQPFSGLRSSIPANNRLRPWLQALATVLALSGALSWTSALSRLDRTLYDLLLHVDVHTPSPEVVLIGIDAKSTSTLGPLPWPNGLYAVGLNRLTAAGARAVAIDVVLPKDEGKGADPIVLSDMARIAAGANATIAAGGDDVLSDALKANRTIVLAADPAATVPGRFSESGTVEGKSGFVADSDGVVRHATLRSAFASPGRPNAEREHLIVSMLRAAGVAMQGVSGASPDVRLPIYGIVGHQPVLSFSDLIRGEIPSAALRQKIVIIANADSSSGSNLLIPDWAHGLGETMPVPLLELDGVLANALFKGNAISNLSTVGILAATLGLVLLTAVIAWVSPSYALRSACAVAFGVLLLCSFLIRYEAVWFPPSSALVGIALTYPLMRWRWLEASAVALSTVFDAILREPTILAEAGTAERSQERHELLKDQIASAQVIASRTRSLRRFLVTAFEDLPYPTLLTSGDGHIVFANRYSRSFFSALNQTQIDGAQLPYLLATLTPTAAEPNFSWWNLIEPQKRQSKVVASDQLRRVVDITCTSCPGASGEVIGWLVTLTDISAMHTAERRRDEALHFISHDLSSQQASILSAVTAESLTPENQVRVEQHARRTLTLADRFVQLSLAESEPLEFTVYDLADLVDEAIAENEAFAHSRGVSIVYQRPSAPVLAEIDTDMLARAFANLLSNSIRFASPQGRVEVRVDETSALGEVTVSFIDDGQGIAPLEQVRMLRILQRILVPGSSQQGGIGLGLSLARVVAEKHRGRLEFTSSPGVGTEFRVVLPRGLDLAATNTAVRSTAPL